MNGKKGGQEARQEDGKKWGAGAPRNLAAVGPPERRSERETTMDEAQTHTEPALKKGHVTVEQIEDTLPSAAAAVHEIIRREGEKEMNRGALALLWSAIAAGLTMSTSFIAKGILQAYLSAESGFFLVVAMGYTMGFILVVTARQQLFTENTITPILPLMTRPSLAKLRCVLRLWGIVFVGNLLGGALAAFIFVRLPVFSPDVLAQFSAIGLHMMENSAAEMFAKGILAGWLVATMVWVLAGITYAKVLMIFLITYLIALGGFTHIIVGSIEVFFLLFNHELTLGSAVFLFALPTLFGNIVGGTCIFALISHAQIRGDMLSGS